MTSASRSWEPQPRSAGFCSRRSRSTSSGSWPTPGFPRAGQTLTLFVTPVVLSARVLIPNQPRGALGAELILTGALAGGILLRINWPSNRTDKEPQMGWLLTRFLPSLLISLLLVVAGFTLILQAGGGLYWIAPVTLVALIAGLLNTWVLLVEILR